MYRLLIFSVILLAGAANVQAHPMVSNVNLPVHHLTPGFRNPDVKQSNINTTVCVHGWTGTVRPPVYYTSYLKKTQIRYYHLDGVPSGYEEDHFIPLSLGGSPFDTRNLWPESRPQATKTDSIELKLLKELCQNKITLKQAQKEIMNWKDTNG